MTSPRPGWYPDPHVAQQMRWWDGSAWTDDTYERAEPIEDWTRPATPAATVGARPVATTDDGAALASWWARAGARLIDLVITSALSWLVAFPQARVATASFVDQFSAAMRAAEAGDPAPAFVYDAEMLQALAVISLVSLGVTLAYEMAFLLWKAATPGKLALGLRVRRLVADQKLTVDVVLRRWLGFEAASSLPYVGTAYLFVDIVWPVRDPRRQALHDKLAGTVVVRRSQPGRAAR
ncbi:RDD family protein [Angustibacter sp. Root456]|uniref:RDD family protein n=1 Tax=Angustibacter sp. Root456 TaxID=1736539 RepID=UPI00138ECD74|nr:RDD family protein [Angustibacter sp. Root456]